MFSMSSFADEYVKIAASKQEAGYQQTRKGRRPIRVHNLLKKTDGMPKTSKDARTEAAVQAAGGLKGLLSRVWQSKALKPAALIGTGAVGAKLLEEGVVEPMQYGYKAKAMGADY